MPRVRLRHFMRQVKRGLSFTLRPSDIWHARKHN
nr:MAG TPA: hypothetical protein [Bacteriophage sp.]